MTDINNRKDIESLVSKFYKKLMKDKKISPVFDNIPNLEHHLPIVCDFWENLLFGGDLYKENLLKKHLDYNEQIPFTYTHLDRWILHWNTTLKENFKGDNTQKVKERAKVIGRLILFKINNPK